ncbi:MAG: guanylate kinase [bacterium]
MNPLLIISGPAGVGKTTVAKALLKTFPQLRSSVTYTTRRPRHKSSEDKKMYHVSMNEFETRKQAGEFLEWAKVHGDYYGTHEQQTMEQLKKHPIIFNIDVQGAKQIMDNFGNQCTTIFLLPESHEQLVDHIKNRGEMTEGDFRTRLKSAEVELAKKDLFQHQIINQEGELSKTIDQIIKIIKPKIKQLTKN